MAEQTYEIFVGALSVLKFKDEHCWEIAASIKSRRSYASKKQIYLRIYGYFIYK